MAVAVDEEVIRDEGDEEEEAEEEEDEEEEDDERTVGGIEDADRLATCIVDEPEVIDIDEAIEREEEIEGAVGGMGDRLEGENEPNDDIEDKDKVGVEEETVLFDEPVGLEINVANKEGKVDCPEINTAQIAATT